MNEIECFLVSKVSEIMETPESTLCQYTSLQDVGMDSFDITDLQFEVEEKYEIEAKEEWFMGTATIESIGKEIAEAKGMF